MKLDECAGAYAEAPRRRFSTLLRRGAGSDGVGLRVRQDA